VDDEGNLWFFTNEYSGKVDEIEHHHDVLLNYNDTSADLYIVVNGRAELVDDKAKMKELWNPVLKLWFPDGLEDERLKLLKVVTHEVEYWNAGSSKIERVFKSVKSLVKGEVYRDDDHKKVTLG
jgi:general stress protein 26